MNKAGVRDYEKFCKEALSITDKPISFEVFADDFDEMKRQAMIISSWGKNVYVKIPITNTKGESSCDLIELLLNDGIKVNVTAITTPNQVMDIFIGNNETPVIFSFFAGRVADTGITPVELVKEIIGRYAPNHEFIELLWASPREVLNIYQAEEAGADIITCTPELIKKYEAMKGKDLNELSLDTVKMFYEDGKAAVYEL